jgi:hypothetical protein
MRRLKIATTISMVFGVGMLVFWPWLLGQAPGQSAPRAQMEEYAFRFLIYVAVLLINFFVTVVLSYLMLRKVREEFLEQSKENLQHLMEETLRDHAKKNG